MRPGRAGGASGPEQLDLLARARPSEAPRRGGARPGAGRKPTGKTRVPHRARPAHNSRHPTHLTLRAIRRAPSLRGQRTFAILQAVIEELGRDAAAEDAGFRVAHYSVQHDHVHLIVEATDGQRLSSGARKLVIRVARRFQEKLGWPGRLWGDRYHRRDLTTPSEVRNALVYVLQNVKKHAGLDRDVEMTDPCSSGPWFEGWAKPIGLAPLRDSPVARPRTWLLATGWTLLGLLRFDEAPAAPRRRVVARALTQSPRSRRRGPRETGQ